MATPTAANVVVAPGAKPFEQFFCELFLEPGDAALLFSPAFPTYEPNLARRGARPVFAPLRQENGFRPDLAAVERFVKSEPRAKAIFLNSPHNPTGGVATKDDLAGIAALVRGTNVAVFSEPFARELRDSIDREIHNGARAVPRLLWKRRPWLRRATGWLAYGYARLAMGIAGIGRRWS